MTEHDRAEHGEPDAAAHASAEEAFAECDPHTLVQPSDSLKHRVLATTAPVVIPVHRRAVLAIAAAVVAVVSVLGVSTIRTSPPLVIDAAATASDAQESKLASRGAPNAAMSSVGYFGELILGDGLAELGGSGRVWKLAPPTKGDVERLAARLGVTDGVAEERDYGSARAEARGWQAGELFVSKEGWWHYTDPEFAACQGIPAVVDPPAVPATKPAPAPAETSNAAATPASPGKPAAAGTTTTRATASSADVVRDAPEENTTTDGASAASPYAIPPDSCSPAGEPIDDTAAKQAASSIFALDGFKTVSVDTYRDAHSVSVSSAHAVAGSDDTPVSWSYAAFDGTGRVLNASGLLANVELAGELDLVSPSVSLARLSAWYSPTARDGTGVSPLPGDAVAEPAATQDAPPVASDTTPTPSTPEPSGTDPSTTEPVVTMPPTPEPLLCAPTPQTSSLAGCEAPTDTPAPARVVITKVTRGYTTITDTNGMMWVVPAWVFHLPQGGTLVGHALPDSVVRTS